MAAPTMLYLQIERKTMYRKMMANITAGVQNQSIDEQELTQEIERAVANLVERLAGRLRNEPYDRLVDRIVSGADPIGHPSEGGELINVIPGDQKLACTRITLAMSTGISPNSSIGFPNVMRAVREYLIDCERMAKAVVLLTDTWSPRHLDEHIRDIRAHARQGRFVVPHLVTGNRILRLDWPSI
jgi:hypothetical protein